MSRISRAVGRWALRLMPARRRDWAEALWAEADQVPAGRARLAWRAGGVGLIAREVLTARRTGAAIVFAAAAVAMAWGAWPGSPANFATLVDRVDVVTTVLLLSAVPLTARRFFGPAYPSRLARILRAGGYVAILALMPAKAVVEQFAYTVPHGGVQMRLYQNVPVPGPPGTVWVAGIRPPGSTWLCESLFLVITAGYVAAIFWLTSRRSLVAPATLAIGLGAGMVLGAVMYAVAPLGLSKSATNPWLPGSDVDPLVWLAWIVLLGGPVAAAVLAGRRYHAPNGPVPAASTSFRQGVAAGLLANLVGALFVTVLGTGTIALTLKSEWLRHWLYHGQHLAGAVSYSHELTASSDAATYLLICLAFPVIGLALGVFGGMDESGTGQSGPPPGGGGTPDPWPEPGPPGSTRFPDAGIEGALLFLDRVNLDGEEAQGDLIGAGGSAPTR